MTLKHFSRQHYCRWMCHITKLLHPEIYYQQLLGSLSYELMIKFKNNMKFKLKFKSTSILLSPAYIL